MQLEDDHPKDDLALPNNRPSVVYKPFVSASKQDYSLALLSRDAITQEFREFNNRMQHIQLNISSRT